MAHKGQQLNAADEKSQSLAKDREELEISQIKQDLEELLSIPAGRRYLMYLYERTGIEHDPMTGNSQTYYLLGRASVGRELRDEIRFIGREHWRSMREERDAEEKLRESQDDAMNQDLDERMDQDYAD